MICISTSAQLQQNLGLIANFNEGLAAIKKGDQWRFIDDKGELVINFRNDLAEMTDKIGSKINIEFNNKRAIISTYEDGITLYGFIDMAGEVAIECEYVNTTRFKNGVALVMHFTKEVVGKNNLLGKDVVSYQIEKYVMDVNGKVVTPSLNPRNYVPGKLKSGEIPEFTTQFIGDYMIALEGPDKNGMSINFSGHYTDMIDRLLAHCLKSSRGSQLARNGDQITLLAGFIRIVVLGNHDYGVYSSWQTPELKITIFNL